MSKYSLFKLNDLASEWCKGQPFKKTDIAEQVQSPCIHYGELFTKYGVVINQCLSKTDVPGKRLSVYGDILFPASDVTPSGLARCSALMQDNVILGGDIIIMRPLHGNDSRYLSYAVDFCKNKKLGFRDLYRHNVALLDVLQCAGITGKFKEAGLSPEERRQLLDELHHLNQQFVELKAVAKKTTGLSQQIELNLQAQKINHEIHEIHKKI